MSNQYIPGTCNLGKDEIRSRQIVALFGLFLTISSVIGILAADQGRSVRFSIFIPAMIFSVGFVQSRSKFCLAYGLAGTFNFERLGKISRVASVEDRRADRKTAITILLKAAALAAVITVVFFVLPL
ncbi:MAG: hypothetical protein JHD34_04195 [Candidatus Nanopelagicus sp.]|jgi:hypothetical protein|nr:hypothetical protein [Candidatus Nanopelagicus sp.]